MKPLPKYIHSKYGLMYPMQKMLNPITIYEYKIHFARFFDSADYEYDIHFEI